jgi:hypothetical protein
MKVLLALLGLTLALALSAPAPPPLWRQPGACPRRARSS